MLGKALDQLHQILSPFGTYCNGPLSKPASLGENLGPDTGCVHLSSSVHSGLVNSGSTSHGSAHSLSCTAAKKKILEPEAGQVCRTQNKEQTMRLLFTSSGPGPPVFPEKSGFPEETFLGRAWCGDRDVMTRSPPALAKAERGRVPRPTFPASMFPGSFSCPGGAGGLGGVDRGSGPGTSLSEDTVPRRLPEDQAGAASAVEARLFPQGLGWGHSGLLGQPRALSSGRNDGSEDVTICLGWPSTQAWASSAVCCWLWRNTVIHANFYGTV